MTLLELLDLLKKRIKLVVALPIALAILVGIYSYVGLSDTYTSTVSMYVLVSQEDSTAVTSLQNDLSASQMVANDVATLLKSNRVLSGAASELGLESLKGIKTSITSSTTSRVISLTVTGEDPHVAADLANEMSTKISEVAREVMNVESVNVVDSAKVASRPSGPNRALYVAVGLLAGLFVAVALVVLEDMITIKIRGQEGLEDLLGVPVIGRIPVVKEA